LNSLYTNTIGYDNTAVGRSSLYSNTTGIRNTVLGNFAGSNITTGSNNIAIGEDAQVPIGTASNQVRIGNTAITQICGQVNFTVCSDKRLKSNILNSNLGLNFISKLRPVSYTRNNDETQKIEYGFIAQEVEEVLEESGVDKSGIINIDDKGGYAMRYNDLLSPMVKAIQELKGENEKLKMKNEKLSSEVESLKSMKEEIVNLRNMVIELTSVKHTLISNKNENKK